MTKDSQQAGGQAAVLHRTSTGAMPQFPSETPEARAQFAARSLPGQARFLDQVCDACRRAPLAFRQCQTALCIPHECHDGNGQRTIGPGDGLTAGAASLEKALATHQ